MIYATYYKRQYKGSVMQFKSNENINSPFCIIETNQVMSYRWKFPSHTKIEEFQLDNVERYMRSFIQPGKT